MPAKDRDPFAGGRFVSEAKMIVETRRISIMTAAEVEEREVATGDISQHIKSLPTVRN